MSASLLVMVFAVILAGCASGPRPGGLFGGAERDGPEANPPSNLAQLPDAEPKVEPIRPGGANKPYTVWGQNYVPLTQDTPFQERGLASWYGRKFNGKSTASGELYNMYAMTAAHPTLPIPSYARIRNPANGREVVVRINDRGPFHSNRIVDLSYTAALKLDLLRGVAPVELERITSEDIRTGAWRHEAATPMLAQSNGPTNVTGNPPSNPSTHAPPLSGPVVVAAADTVAVSTVQAMQTAATPPPPPPPLAPLTPPTAIENAPSMRAFTTPARGFWVQLGAFRQRDGAVSFQKQVEAQVDWVTPLLAVFGESSIFRVQAGPYASRDDARDVAERLRAALQLVPVIVERR